MSTRQAAKDYTYLLRNTDFHHPWELPIWSDNSKANMAGGNKENACAEIYHKTFDFAQTVSVSVLNGDYKLYCQGFYRKDSGDDPAYLYANTAKTVLAYLNANGEGTAENMAGASTSFSEGKYVNSVEVTVTDNTLKVGISNDNAGNWVVFDNFYLEYLGASLAQLKTDYDAALTAAKAVDQTAAMNATVLANLQQAISNYTTVDETSKDALTAARDALTAATDAANASIAAYANAKAYLDRIYGYLNGENTFTNFYTTAAYNTYYADIKAAYDGRTLTTEQEASLSADLAYQDGTAWHKVNNLDNIMLSVWKQDNKQSNEFDTGLHLNTWSIEGNTDGSEFYAPFYEYWVSSENVLAASTMTATITGLKANETYSVTIRARVQPTDNKTMIDNAVTMQVGSGDAVCISGGAKFGTTNYYIGNFSAVGTTDADGNLITTITVADASNVSWLSFYNVRYTEGEDLSAYIADYEFALSTANSYDLKGMDPKLSAAFSAAVTAATLADVNTATKTQLIDAKNALDNAMATVAASVASFAGTSATGWTKSETNGSLQANTWSNEGNTDSSNMTTPFLQVHQGKEYGGLSDNVITYAMTGETQGYYKVTALVRVLNEKDGTVSPKGAFIYANDNIERAYGTNTSTCTNGVYGNPIVYGYVGEDGKLDVGFKLIETNCNWISWKNLKIEYVGTSLTSEIAANQTEEARTFDNLTTGAAAAQTAAVNALSTLSDANYAAAGQAIEAAYKSIDREFSALQAAITAKTGYVLGFETGEYAPYSGIEAALSAANAIDQTSDASTQAEINTATTNLTAVTSNAAEVNGFYDPQFAACAEWESGATNSTPTGWRKHDGNTDATNVRYAYPEEGNGANKTGLSNGATSGCAIFFKSNGNGTTGGIYGSVDGYTLPLKANTVYTLTFKYAGWGNSDATPVVSYRKSDAESYTTIAALASPALAGNSATTAWPTATLKFLTGEAGNYIIKFADSGNGKQFAITDLSLLKATAVDITLSEEATTAPVTPNYANVTLTRTLSKDHWNTFCLPFDMTAEQITTVFGSGTKITEYDSEDTENRTVTMKVATAIGAGVPYLIKPTNTTTTPTISGVIVKQATGKTVGENYKFIGVIQQTAIAAAPSDGTLNYFLNTNNQMVKPSTDGNLKGMRAYFNIPAAASGESPVRVLISGFDDESTGISTVQSDASPRTGTVYDLSGRRVQNPQHGIYVKNGKKVVIK